MERMVVFCLVVLFVVGMPVSVEASDAGGITLDFTPFNDQMERVKQLEKPSYGTATRIPVKSTDFIAMNIRVVKVDEGIESTCWESNTTTSENISIPLDPGLYKVYTQLEDDDTVLESNNDSEGYVITSQSHLVIPLKYSPLGVYILDVPWRVEKSEIYIPILAVDTGLIWADIYNITVHDHNDGDRLVASTNWSFTQPIGSSTTPFFHLFNINKSSFVHVDGEVSISIKFALQWWPDNWEGPLNVSISHDDIPELIDWYAGDTHLHTNYTSNVYEFGAPIYAFRAAHNAMGLDWMIVTDHSFDLDPATWENETADCDAHSDDLFRVIRGEEVSCYLPGTDTTPGQYQYSHLLVYGADFIPGGEWEDGTDSNYTPAEAIALANSHGGVTYPAHPFYDDPFRDPWRDEDYDLAFTGLQIWNHLSDAPTHLPDGLTKWRELLLGGRHVYVEGGTDAHGDFNTHAGRVKTYICTENFTEDGILDALRNGHSIMTDGPLVVFDINGEIIGDDVSLTKGTNATLRIRWNSTQEFGYLNAISVIKGVISGTEETNVTTIIPASIGKDLLCDEHELILSPHESCYYRIEAYSNTTDGEQYRCYTNPIWVNVVNDTTPPVVTISNPVNGSVLSTPDVTVTGFATDDVGIVTMCYGYACKAGGGGGCQDLANASTNVSINYTFHLSPGWWYLIEVTALDKAGNSGNASVVFFCSAEEQTFFDTEAGTYPSIAGVHNGTITPNQTINVSKLYTYPCAGTGGHTEYVKIWNVTWNVTATWNGYTGDWQNISFDNSFTLDEGKAYNYTIKTGSYPQIIHEPSKIVTGGTITCTSFEDANGRTYNNWIPAFRLFL